MGEEEFLDVAQQSIDLDIFLKITEYPAFLERMQNFVHQQQGLQGGPSFDPAMLAVPRPLTPHSRTATQQRLAELDQSLAGLDQKRNELLAERRRLIGCEIRPTTTCALKEQLEVRRWKDDVGLD